jgi:hypothetical protein
MGVVPPQAFGVRLFILPLSPEAVVYLCGSCTLPSYDDAISYSFPHVVIRPLEPLSIASLAIALGSPARGISKTIEATVIQRSLHHET